MKTREVNIDALRIRPARADDAETLTAIRYAAILILATEKMSRDRGAEWANAATPGRIRRAIAEHQVWIAELAGQAAGWVEVERNHIRGLYVQPEQARQGIGSLLLAHAEAQIWLAGFRSVRLNASWNAEQFYLKRGYQPYAERTPEAGLPMLKPL